MLAVSRVSIRTRIFLSAAALTAALAIPASFLEIKKQERYASSHRLEHLAAIATQMSSIIHELQLERGKFASFISNQGTSRWRVSLRDQIAATDAVLSEAIPHLERFPAHHLGPKLEERIDIALMSLNELQAHRRRAWGQTTALTEIAAFYTSRNRKFLDAIATIAELAQESATGTKATAFLNLLEAKERTDRQRTMGIAGFSEPGYMPHVFAKIVTLVGEQGTSLVNVTIYENDRASPRSRRNQAGASAERIQAYRTANPTAGFTTLPMNYNGSEWFTEAAQEIDLMHSVEKAAAAELIAASTVASRAARKELLHRSFVTADEYNQYNALESLKRLSEIAPQLSDAVHAFQRERASTAGYVASHGAAKWRQSLQDHIAETDPILRKVMRDLEQFPTAQVGPLVAEKIQLALSILRKIETQRAQAWHLKASVSDVAAYYTNLNRALLDTISAIPELIEDADVQNKAAAYLQMAEAKERADIERVVAVVGFIGEDLTPNISAKLVTLVGEQGDYATSVVLHGPEAENAINTTPFSAPAVEWVQTYRSSVLDAGNAPLPANYADAEWIDEINRKFELMHVVEQNSTEALIEKTTADRFSAEKVHTATWLTRTILLAAAAIALALGLLSVFVPQARLKTTVHRRLFRAPKALSQRFARLHRPRRLLRKGAGNAAGARRRRA